MGSVMIAALQAQVADLKRGLSQANQVTSKLMSSKLNRDQRDELFNMIVTHVSEQDVSKSAQLVGVIQTALLELNQLAQATNDPAAKHRLVEIIKALTLTVACAEHSITN